MLKQVTVLSGKGGVGKTTLIASLAVLAGRVVVADCDVDAPNLHLLLNSEVIEEKEFKGGKMAVLDASKCTGCGACEKHCRFNAISCRKIDPVLCEGCGVCAYVCPIGAIELREEICGHTYVSKTRCGFMSHARLNPGEENTGKLVTLVRQRARQIAEDQEISLMLNDGPPGIGCPVIASIAGVDAGLVVAEPTMSGIHDFKRVLQLLKHFNVPPFICINIYDINRNNSGRILEFCEKNDIEVVGRIPFNPAVTDAMVRGMTIVEHSPDSDVAREILNIWDRLKSKL
ncbi:MAG: nucleotide-binding protein [Thermoproteota archaeon]